MCTAISLCTRDHYFGRTLDLDASYGEEVCLLPRRFPLTFRRMGRIDSHYAMIGMATVVGDTPLLYEAVNEKGLAMAGLNFPGNAYYAPEADGKDNIAPFEFIPWILSGCGSIKEARLLLDRLNLFDIPFSRELPLSPLHWMLADKSGSLVVEAMRDGLHIYENPVGVMTNNPPFPIQLQNLEKYRHLRNDNQGIEREDGLPYVSYCQGLGAVGLPGDVSSGSRFVRLAFLRKHFVSELDEASSVGGFFHLLSSVEMIKGACRTDGGRWDITGYTACMNLDRLRYYYTTYENRRISCIDMQKAPLDGETLLRFQLLKNEDIFHQN